MEPSQPCNGLGEIASLFLALEFTENLEVCLAYIHALSYTYILIGLVSTLCIGFGKVER